MAREENLLRLQESLQRLKGEFDGRLHLSKSRGSGAPFPVTATLKILAPAELDAYDVSGFKVAATLTETVLDSTGGVEITVLTDELPAVLKTKMADILHDQHNIGAACYGLQAVFEYAEAHVLALLTSLPELVEAYESVDANGASMRRFMINDPQSHLEAEPDPTSMPRPSCLEAELVYMERRYRSAFHLASSSVRSKVTSFTLLLEPTDPSWENRPPLLLRGEVGAGYPQPRSATLEVAEGGSLDAEGRAIVGRIIAASLESALERSAANASNRTSDALREVIRSIENCAGEFLRLAEDVRSEVDRRRSTRPEEEGAERTSDQELEKFSRLDLADHGSSSEPASEEWSSDGSDTEGSSEERATRGRAEQKLEGRVVNLVLEGLKLDNVIALEPLRLLLQAACKRCGASWDVQLATGAVADDSAQSGQCQECSQAWSLELRALLVHDHNNAAAILKAEGCFLTDLLPSMYSAQCAGCSSMASFRSVYLGQASTRNCSSCHIQMAVSYLSAQFVPRKTERLPACRRRGPESSVAASHNSGPRGPKFEGSLTVGQPLPAMGTCRHYPHSHRWLRFPCCGRRFPCDLCHEEAADGHEMKWAVRHVCGFCSTEQRIDDRCTHCNKRLAFNSAGALGAPSRHWEGGQGCRDKMRLDRRDRAKYRGSKHKTVSKKAFRVGQEGASRRDKR